MTSSAFGVVHKKEVPDAIAPVLPSTTVMAYNNSRRDKKKAAAHNFAAKVAGTGLGIGAGYAAYKAGARKIPYLKTASTHAIGRRPIVLSADKKQGYAASVATSAGGGLGGYIGSRASLEHIKSNKKYRYKKG